MRDRFTGVLGEETDPAVLATNVLGMIFLLALLVVVLFAIAPIGVDDPYTEFYILGAGGNASEYPENVTLGETSTIDVGIGNFESQQVTYTLVVQTNRTTFEQRELTLEPRERWEEPMSFTFNSTGSQWLHLELYRGETTRGEPYRDLQLLIEVTQE